MDDRRNKLQTYTPGTLVRRETKEKKLARKEAEWQSGIQRVYHGVDKPLLIIVILLVSLGTITLLSASYPYAISREEGALKYFTSTIFYVAIGTVGILAFCFIPRIIDIFNKISPFIYGVTTGLLVLVLLIGKYINGARRRFNIGPISIQPSEIAKLALILILAWYFQKSIEYLNVDKRFGRIGFNIVIPALMFGLYVILILAEKHLSCVVIMTIIFLSINIMAGVKFKYLAIYLPVGGVVAGLYLATHSYALERILTHSAGEDADKLAEAWQSSQALLAIGNGGLLGVGLGQSSLKFSYISEPMNDFIFSVYCEEMGFVGAVLLIVLFGLLVWRGIKISIHAKDVFSQLTAFGITVHLGIQAMFNLMVVTGIFPNTGISLPFFSYGGSALMMQMFEVGILLAISRYSYIKKGKGS